MTHRHVPSTYEIEHLLIVLLELRQVDVLFDALVLGSQLCQTAHDMHRALQYGRSQAMGWFWRRWSREVSVKNVKAVQNLQHNDSRKRELDEYESKTVRLLNDAGYMEVKFRRECEECGE